MQNKKNIVKESCVNKINEFYDPLKIKKKRERERDFVDHEKLGKKY